MNLIISISEETYNEIKQGFYNNNVRKMARAIGNGTPLKLLDDGTQIVSVSDASRVGRVLIQDGNNNGGLYYKD